MSSRAIPTVLMFGVLMAAACKKDDADADPRVDAGAAFVDAGAAKQGASETDPDQPTGRTAAEEKVYKVPWRSEVERAIFDLRLPLPSTALLITEEAESPVKRYRERRSDMSFFVERRGLRGMPQTLPLDEAARWYIQLYQGYELRGPADAAFGLREAVRADFLSKQDDKELHVTLFVVFRGGYLYGIGIESTLPKRVEAAAARLSARARFMGEEPMVEVGPYKSLEDISVALPGALGLIQARGLGGVSLTDRDTRFHMLVSRIALKDAPWAADIKSYTAALEAQRFPGYEFKAAKPVKVGRNKGMVFTYVTDGRTNESKVFIRQHVATSSGYIYLFTASSDARFEDLVTAWSTKTLKGARFLRPF